MFASTIRENKFKIRLEYLKENKKEKKNSNALVLQFFLLPSIVLEVVVLGSL